MTRALVVDDNVDLAANVAELLETTGMRVVIANDADAADQRAAEGSFDLAIVDVRLPRGTSGVDLVPRLRAASPEVEIIIVTGNATVDSAVAAVRHGIFAYVQKPFDSKDLLAIATRAVERSHARRERSRLSAELARSEALYRGLVDTVDAAIVLVDREGRIGFSNRFATRFTHSGSSEALEGRTFADAFGSGEEAPKLRKLVAERGDSGRARSLETTIGTAGARRVIRWTANPLATEGRESVLMVGVDLTEVRDLQRRTVEAEALASVGALTTGLAHEIRNPLNAASLQLELLVRSARRVADDALRTGMEGRVALVRDELGRLERMLQDFLSLARPRVLDLVTVDLALLLGEVVALEAPVAERQGAELKLEAPIAEMLAHVDPARIKQVLINLVVNALDALRPSGGGSVTVEAERVADGWIEIRVVDDGPGVSSKGDALFEPFVTTKEGGTGLGLSIVRTIVERHGGEVALVPRPSGGTIARFTVRAAT